MPFLEPLPDGCPPADAEEILEPRVVFRVVRNNPATDDDFRSQRAENPKRNFNVCECVARGLSILDNFSDASQLLKLPRYKKGRVSRVTLVGGAGRIKQTFKRPHYTWWPLAAFHILENCQIVQS